MGDDVVCGGSLYFSDGNGCKLMGAISGDGITLHADEPDGWFTPDMMREESYEMRLRTPWPAENNVRRIVSYISGRRYVPAYTVRRLRRGGKSHRGKELRWQY